MISIPTAMLVGGSGDAGTQDAHGVLNELLDLGVRGGGGHVVGYQVLEVLLNHEGGGLVGNTCGRVICHFKFQIN